jgi:thiamine-phosphate pyrophosphorylase
VAGYERCAEAAVITGVRWLQLRMKGAPRPAVADVARRLRAITAQTPVRFIINDDAALAEEIGADGVHLGQGDTPLTLARRQHPGLAVFGLSTHNAAQAAAATALAPGYIGVGPIFATPSKARPDPVLGLARAARILSQTPLTAVAIGGIDAGNLKAVLAAGAGNFAVIRAVCSQADPAGAIRRLQEIWHDFETARQQTFGVPRPMLPSR